ncbi:MAG: peptide-methionine (S)-S-oxide reductase MsrA [Gemmatimonadaceae bacterium]|nr:peptide-methionine (S)-S-oxide reductase MsrA [Gemmatimonadaceae bacterium]
MIGSIARGLTIAAAAVGGTFAVSKTTTHTSDLSAVLPRAEVDAKLSPTKGKETAVFAGGCFWGIDAVFKHVKGVMEVTSGYAGGTPVNPSYEEVSTGTTGHAEAVRVVYDPSQVTYAQLLQVFFASHDPTELNRQGPDVGSQYRSAVFYVNDQQKQLAAAYIKQLTNAKTFRKPIVTEVSKLSNYSLAEAYHQNYLALHPYQPYIVINDAPKLTHLKRILPALYSEAAAK